MSPSLDEVLKAADEAIRLPQSATQIYDLASDVETQMEDLVSAIEVDPAFTAQLLRVANSSAYSPSGSVTDMAEAVVRLGRREVAQLALVMAAGSEFSALENELLRLSSYWRHSLSTAVLAQKILKCYGLPTDGAFSAGLLHDLGLMVLFYSYSDVMVEVLDYSLESEYIRLVDAEKRILGFDHTEVGSAIAESWGLPEVIVEAIRYHHNPAGATKHTEVVHAVSFANALDSADLLDDLVEFPFIDQCLREELNTVFELEKMRPIHGQLLQESKSEALELLSLFGG